MHLPERARYVGRSHAEGNESHRIHFDAHFALDTADAIEAADTAHTQHCLRDFVIDEPGQRFFIQPRRGDREHLDRFVRDGHGADRRLLEIGGQFGAHAIHRVLGFDERVREILLDDELDDDRDLTIVHGGAQMPQARERGERVLYLARHFRFELRRRGAWLHEGDVDRRQVDIRQVLDRQRAKSPQPCQRQQHEERGSPEWDSGSTTSRSSWRTREDRRGVGGLSDPHDIAVIQESSSLHDDAIAGRQAACNLHLSARAPPDGHRLQEHLGQWTGSRQISRCSCDRRE